MRSHSLRVPQRSCKTSNQTSTAAIVASTATPSTIRTKLAARRVRFSAYTSTTIRYLPRRVRLFTRARAVVGLASTRDELLQDDTISLTTILITRKRLSGVTAQITPRRTTTQPSRISTLLAHPQTPPSLPCSRTTFSLAACPRTHKKSCSLPRTQTQTFLRLTVPVRFGQTVRFADSRSFVTGSTSSAKTRYSFLRVRRLQTFSCSRSHET